MKTQLDTLTPNLAVLIDADNTSSSVISGLLAEIARYGTASIKRIYGDWTNTRLILWKNILLEHAIQPIQQFNYINGKNSTDSAMIIDAMDLLYCNAHLDGFCIVSRDSDFTRLASRLREAGKTVYGFGKQTTPSPFCSVCDRFIYTETFAFKSQLNEPTNNLSIKSPPKKVNDLTSQPTKKSIQTEAKKEIDISKNTKIINLLRSAFEASSNNNGCAELSSIASYIQKNNQGVSSKTYGYAKFKTLLKASKQFELLKNGKTTTIKLAS